VRSEKTIYICNLLVYLYCLRLLALFALTRHQYMHFIIWHFLFVLLYLLLDFCLKQFKVGSHCTKNMESGFASICELPSLVSFVFIVLSNSYPDMSFMHS